MFTTLSNGGFGFLSLYRELFYYMNGADEWVGSCGVSLLGKRKKKDRMIKKQAYAYLCTRNRGSSSVGRA